MNKQQAQDRIEKLREVIDDYRYHYAVLDEYLFVLDVYYRNEFQQNFRVIVFRNMVTQYIKSMF